ncbi:MAG: hypothetical protein ACKO3T_18775, partial [Planctomycetaceae bacterium]
GTLSEARHYYYTPSWQVVEERVGTSTSADRQFVWGLRYIDDLVLRDRDTDGNGTLDERRYCLQDGNWNTIALTSSTGTITERFSYDAYGVPTFLTSTGTVQAFSVTCWETLYAGYRWDGDPSRMYYVRNRFLLPYVGTWNKRDPLGYSSGLSLYELVSSSPESMVDGIGLFGDNSAASLCETSLLARKPMSCIGCHVAFDPRRPWTDELQAERDRYLRFNSHDPLMSSIIADINHLPDAIISTRGQGVIRTAGGASEALVGLAGLATPEPTMATKVAGGIALAHGLDGMQAGLRQIWTNQSTTSGTHEAISRSAVLAGASPETANGLGTFGDAAIGLGASSASGFFSSPGQVASRVSAADAAALRAAGATKGKVSALVYPNGLVPRVYSGVSSRARSYLPIQGSTRLGPQAGEVSDDIMQFAGQFGSDFRYGCAELPALTQASRSGQSILGPGSLARDIATGARTPACSVRATGGGGCSGLLKAIKGVDHAGF